MSSPHYSARRELGRRLKTERETLAITREELAARLLEDVAVVKRWELGRTRIPAERLVPIATCLGITVQRLLGQDYTQLQRAA